MTTLRTTFGGLLISAPLVALFAVTSPVANAQSRLMFDSGEGLKIDPPYEWSGKRTAVKIGKLKLPGKGVIHFAAGTMAGTALTAWWCKHTGWCSTKQD